MPFSILFKRYQLDAIDQIIMPNLWLFLLALPMLWYAYVILRLNGKPLRERQEVAQASLPFISVVIPFRNESRWLNYLLESLIKQDYPPDLWELIMVDDHSLDSGPILVKRAMEDMKTNTHFIPLENGYGKKDALTAGISLAQSDWILATDADCSFEASWLRSYGKLIASEDTAMICGAVLYHKDSKSWLAAFQKFEQAILMFVGRASILNGKAFLANGANMAFKKSAFIKADLKASNTASGDDIFLLHHIKQKDPDKIRFNDAEEALVRTPAKESIIRFLDQRIRWASKSRYYKDSDSLKYGLAIALGNAFVVISLILFSFQFFNFWSLLTLILIKLLGDLAVFIRSKPYLELPHPFLSFLLIFLTYPFYSIGVALLSLLYKPRWKGRKI